MQRKHLNVHFGCQRNHWWAESDDGIIHTLSNYMAKAGARVCFRMRTSPPACCCRCDLARCHTGPNSQRHTPVSLPPCSALIPDTNHTCMLLSGPITAQLCSHTMQHIGSPWVVCVCVSARWCLLHDCVFQRTHAQSVVSMYFCLYVVIHPRESVCLHYTTQED